MGKDLRRFTHTAHCSCRCGRDVDLGQHIHVLFAQLHINVKSNAKVDPFIGKKRRWPQGLKPLSSEVLKPSNASALTRPSRLYSLPSPTPPPAGLRPLWDPWPNEPQGPSASHPGPSRTTRASPPPPPRLGGQALPQEVPAAGCPRPTSCPSGSHRQSPGAAPRPRVPQALRTGRGDSPQKRGKHGSTDASPGQEGKRTGNAGTAGRRSWAPSGHAPSLHIHKERARSYGRYSEPGKGNE